MPVGDKRIAVAIQNFTARRLHPRAGGADGLTLLGIFRAMDKLQLNKTACKKKQEYAQQADGDDNAGGTFVLIHRFGPSFHAQKCFRKKSEKTQRSKNCCVRYSVHGNRPLAGNH